MTQEPVATPLFHEIPALQVREKTYAYRPLKGPTYAVLALLGSNAALEAVNVVALLGRWNFLGRVASQSFPSRAAMLMEARASDALVLLTAIVVEASLIAAYVAAGVWIYRAACNVRAFGARGLQNSPGWAIGWYAVPVANWFKPFAAMEEIYRASVSPLQWRSQRTPALLRIWWAGWLASGLSGWISFVTARNMPHTVANVQGLTVYSLLESVIDLVALGLFAIVVWRIYRAQAAGSALHAQVAEVFG